MGFDFDLDAATVYALLPDGKREVIKKIKASETFEAGKYIKIRKVIFSGPATIVFWNDGSKTVTKCAKDDDFNYELGIAMCMLKKIFGESYKDFKKDSKKWIPEEKKDGWSINVRIAPDYSHKIKEHLPEFAKACANFMREWAEGCDCVGTAEVTGEIEEGAED